MKKQIILVALLIGFLFSVPCSAVWFSWRKVENNAFNEGEKITFSIQWQFVSVGEATMEIVGIEKVNGRKCYHVVSTAQSSSFFDNVFKVRDINESWIDVKSICSQKSKSDISEGTYKKVETIIFDQKKKTFNIVEKNTTGPIPDWVQDVLSSLYYLRTFDLAVGEEYNINAHTGDKSWPLIVRVTGRENLLLPMGQFDCFVVEPSIREGEGIFQSSGDLKVWVTADKKKLPIKMSTKILIGSIVAEAMTIETGE